ncbi:hypothetical protein FXO38_04668 [Capsicum annuum]|nr:hypothetical protein FXO38_04668 [Capsicum annuum]
MAITDENKSTMIKNSNGQGKGDMSTRKFGGVERRNNRRVWGMINQNLVGGNGYPCVVNRGLSGGFAAQVANSQQRCSEVNAITQDLGYVVLDPLPGTGQERTFCTTQGVCYYRSVLRGSLDRTRNRRDAISIAAASVKQLASVSICISSTSLYQLCCSDSPKCSAHSCRILKK